MTGHISVGKGCWDLWDSWEAKGRVCCCLLVLCASWLEGSEITITTTTKTMIPNGWEGRTGMLLVG